MSKPTTICKGGKFQGCYDSAISFVQHLFDVRPQDFNDYVENGIFDAARYAHDCQLANDGAYEFLKRSDGQIDVWYVG